MLLAIQVAKVPNDHEVGDKLTKAFRDGSVFDAGDDELNRYLKHLCSGHVANEGVRHREMNRCQVINTIKTFRFIDSVERSNKIFTCIIILLTIITIVLSYFSITQSQDSYLQMESLVLSQETKEEKVINILTQHIDKQNQTLADFVHQNSTQNHELAKLVKQNSNIVSEIKSLSTINNDLISVLKENMDYNKSITQEAMQKTRSAP